MNITHSIFLLVFLSFNTPLFASQAPLKRSGIIAIIPAFKIDEVAEAHSLESATTSSSAEVTPKTSVSPSRRSSDDDDDTNTDELFPEPKIFSIIVKNISPERKRDLLNVIEKRLNDFAERARLERTKLNILEEEKSALKNYYYPYPGCREIHTIAQLIDAENNASALLYLNDN